MELNFYFEENLLVNF